MRAQIFPREKSHDILEKTWLVRHVVVLEHFPSLPLKLLYPLFLLLGTIYITLLQKPATQLERRKKKPNSSNMRQLIWPILVFKGFQTRARLTELFTCGSRP